MRVTVPCPAKINLFLAVGPVDARGYHPLRTVFQTVGLFDELVLDDSLDPGFFCDDPSVPLSNTVTRAQGFIGEIAMVPPLRVELTKRIPSPGGLGGGSSDAAGYLRAINRFLPAPISWDHLMDIAFAVGADVPFFMIGGQARGEGYGEVLAPLPDPLVVWYVIAKPSVGMPTASAFGALDALEYDWRSFPSSPEFYNDFERVAPGESLALISRLRGLGCSAALLCGSGSAVFGVASSQAEAELIAAGMAAEGLAAFAAPGLSRAESLRVL